MPQKKIVVIGNVTPSQITFEMTFAGTVKLENVMKQIEDRINDELDKAKDFTVTSIAWYDA